MLTAQREDSESQAPSIVERLPADLSEDNVRNVRGEAARLDVPERPPYGEDFYRRVAETYLRLVDGTYAPAALIADANGINVGRVRWWIAEARRMGYLPPGRKGKAG